MTTQLNEHQRSVQNEEEFCRQFTVLHQAAVGVVLVRTREPFRAIDTIRELTFREEGLEFKCWSILHGWATYDRNSPDSEPQTDSNVNPLEALVQIGNLSRPQGSNRSATWGNGVYCFMYPHLVNLNKNPSMIHCIKEYNKLFAEDKRRLVLVTPLSYELPPELEDDVVILDYEPPSYAELRTLYDRLLDSVPENRRPQYEDEEIDRILSAGAGMVAAEFDTAVSRGFVINRSLLPGAPIDNVVDVVMKVKTEMVKKSEVLSLMESEDLSNVGGLNNLKDWLAKRQQCFGQAARDFGIDPPRGIALIGPPGTGKSLVAKATSHMLGLPLIRFDVSKVFQSLVGQSESRVRAALKMIDAMAPCVMFLDEADKAFQANASSGDSGVGQRVLGTILTWMQESKAPVFIVVTANRVDNLPAEFLRRGRLDEVFSVQMPSEEERLEVFRIHLRKRGQDPDAIEDLNVAVERSNGYVPSELEQAVKDALIESFTADGDPEPLTGALIAAQLDTMKPLSVAFADQFRTMAEWAANNARPANVGEPNVPMATRTRTRRANADGDAPTGSRSGMDLDG